MTIFLGSIFALSILSASLEELGVDEQNQQLNFQRTKINIDAVHLIQAKALLRGWTWPLAGHISIKGAHLLAFSLIKHF